MIAGAGLSLSASLVTGATAHAATYDVDTTADDGGLNACTATAGDCSLRGAIGNANGSAGVTDYVTFDAAVTGTITLAGTQLEVTGETYIYGPGAEDLTISANNASRIFNLNMAGTGDVFYVGGLTLTGGSVEGDGGAIRNVNAALQVVSSVLTGNSAIGGDGDGGAIYTTGVFNDGYSNVVANSTINGNTATDKGGGFYGFESAGAFYNSTISGNTAGIAATPNGNGGGIYTYFDTYLVDTTVFGNHADNGGGIIEASDPSGPAAILDNSIVAGNTASNTAPDVQGTADAGFSLLQSTAGTTLISNPASSNLTGIPPLLGILQDNGGDTPTHQPGANSPVIDCGRSPESDDQRGSARTVDQPGRTNSNVPGADGTDMGSVELAAGAGSTGACANVLAPPVTPPATPAPPVKKKKKKCKKKIAPGKKKKCKKKKKK